MAWNNGLRCIAGLLGRSSVDVTNLSLGVLPFLIQTKIRSVLFFKRMCASSSVVVQRLANRWSSAYRRSLAPVLASVGLTYGRIILWSKFHIKAFVKEHYVTSCDPYKVENANLLRRMYGVPRSPLSRALIHHLSRPSYMV